MPSIWIAVIVLAVLDMGVSFALKSVSADLPQTRLSYKRRRCPMDWDDVRSKTASIVTLGENLTAMSVADLKERIRKLEAIAAGVDL